MRKIGKIARLELSVFFYSPIAWVLMIIFMIQCGVSIMDLLSEKESSQQLGAQLQSLTADVFAGPRGFFRSVLKYTYLYIPLLTMGIISRELSSGTIKLLQSSPVTNTQVVLGKYLGLLIFSIYFVFILFGIAVTGSFLIGNFDWGVICAGICGIYLLIAAYAAIGLFMSSLTSYQIVAAISTLAVLVGLNFVGEIGKGNPFLREITYWLSLQGRTDHFVNGMISSQDSIYFVLVIMLFIGCTIIRMNNEKSIRSEVQNNLRYVGWIAGIIAIGFVSSLPLSRGYLDLSRFEANTLTANSKEVISNLKQPLKVKNYVNILHPLGRLGTPKWRKFDLKQFEQYIRYIPRMDMEYIYYYDYTPRYADSTVNLLEKAQKAALAHGVEFTEVLAPAEIKKIVDLGPENNSFVRYLHHGQDSVVLRMYLDATGYPTESAISSALKQLYIKSPVIGFLQGADERSIYSIGDKSYNRLVADIQTREAIVNSGFQVRTLTPNELDTVGDKLTALVIADPYNKYSDEAVENIRKYIQKGGSALFAAEPTKVGFLNDVLVDLPVKFANKQVYHRSKDVEAEVVQAQFSNDAIEFGFAKSTKSLVSLKGAAPLLLNENTGGYKITTVLNSSNKDSWLGNIQDSTSKLSQLGSSQIMAVALTKVDSEEHEQRILLIGDADFMSNSELNRHNMRTVNDQFSLSLFKWFSQGAFPVDTQRPAPIDNKILVKDSTLNTIKYTWIGFMPLGLGIIGAVVLIRRKRK
ncbi:Gldg family protein [Sphingobacterium sp. UT-1RO-CII-1]|uniref:Gldg family protein n=1 Tax=Sphingobacterium sp. UT-1RO-CII-1 TaxID=2995225 RepID=UPI00227AFC6E|nr:Gldg family protein [Sphingobacterium sp. UT-1RO-CII-1]MCY4780732.1 Gldg family protein [Sphingobacterium sp. UT-1RO-CII-1]